jgi:hypothetical protein
MVCRRHPGADMLASRYCFTPTVCSGSSLKVSLLIWPVNLNGGS